MKEEVTAPVGWIGGYKAMARYCGVSPRTIGRWVESGVLNVKHLSSRRVVARPMDLDAAVERVAARQEVS